MQVEFGGADSALAVQREQALQTLIRFAQNYRGQLSYVTATAGAAVPAANRRIYVDLHESDTTEPEEAMWDKFQPADGDVILLKRLDVFGLGGWYILGWVTGADTPCAG